MYEFEQEAESTAALIGWKWISLIKIYKKDTFN